MVPLAVVVGIVVLLGHLGQHDPWWVVALEMLTCVVAGAASRWKIARAALVVPAALYLLVPTSQATIAQLAFLIPVYAVAAQGRLREVLGFGLPVLLLLLIDTARVSPTVTDALITGLFWVGAFALAWLVGNTIRLSRKEAQADFASRRLAERAELARELHDTVAHSLSMLSMRAQSAQLRGSATPEDLTAFTEVSARCVQELYTVMDLLRTTHPVPEDAGTWRLPSLPEVIERAASELREHGFRVSIDVEGDPDLVSGQLAETAGRVAREAVNNIERHCAPGALCSILVEVDGELTVAFLNPLDAQRNPDPVPGLGILGMTERVESLGGTLVAEPSGSQWLVQATFPLPGVEAPKEGETEGERVR